MKSNSNSDDTIRSDDTVVTSTESIIPKDEDVILSPAKDPASSDTDATRDASLGSSVTGPDVVAERENHMLPGMAEGVFNVTDDMADASPQHEIRHEASLLDGAQATVVDRSILTEEQNREVAGMTVGDGFRFGCGFVLAMTLGILALLIVLTAFVVVGVILGVKIPVLS
jgi:hypothetical protein